MERPIFHAETCHTGGFLCRHHHRTREAAERCLPRLPRGRGTSGTFSLAAVIAINAAARAADEEDERAFLES